ncbi:uncharacterized protein LOC135479275 isoform X1 [Liolophura sinensis]|uniref:uncharacterized protein LOC135479275 isoform X1 n=1 Tax=Liolophura sinensis TaxID=3198878 RepID=UPI0031587737
MAALTRSSVLVAILAICILYVWSKTEASPAPKATGKAGFRTDLEKVIHATRQQTPFRGRQKRSISLISESDDAQDRVAHRTEVDSAPSRGQWYTERRAYRLRGITDWRGDYGNDGRDTYYYGGRSRSGGRSHGHRYWPGHEPGGRSHGRHQRGCWGCHSGGRSRGFDQSGGRSRGWDHGGGRSREWGHSGGRSRGHGGRSRGYAYGSRYDTRDHYGHSAEDRGYGFAGYHTEFRYGSPYGRHRSGGGSPVERRHYQARIIL